MQKKNNDFKLPAIQTRTKESSKILSNTMPENSFNGKLRPSSLNKVEDLQKKLFSKLDSYESASKKSITKRMSKKGKASQMENINGGDGDIQGYQKMQKLMPGLYNKLIEAKKGSLVDILPLPFESPSIKSQPKIERDASTSEDSRTKERKDEKSRTFVTNFQQKVEKDVGMYMSQKEMQELYEQYNQSQGLARETSNSQIEAMGKSLMVCEKDIDQLKRSMQSLIKQIGMECLAAYEQGKEE